MKFRYPFKTRMPGVPDPLVTALGANFRQIEREGSAALDAHKAQSFGAGHALPTAATPMNGQGFTGLGTMFFDPAVGARIQGRQVAGEPVLANRLLAADSWPAFVVRGDGKLEWGPGGASALDTMLARVAPGYLDITNIAGATAMLRLEGKDTLYASDTWLRINPSNHWSNGVYFYSSVVRTDGEFHLGASGGNVRINSAGITLGTGKKVQQNAAPTVGDDLVNKTYADTKVPASIVDAKGDLIVGTAADTVGRLGAGSAVAGAVLQTDPAGALGVTWSARPGLTEGIAAAKGDLLVGAKAGQVVREPVGGNRSILTADSAAAGGVKWGAAPSSQTIGLFNTVGGALGSVSSGVMSPVHFNIHDHLVGNQTYSTAGWGDWNNYIQVNEAGYYQVTGSLLWAGSGVLVRIAMMVHRHRDSKNIIEAHIPQPGGVGEIVVAGTKSVYLQANDRLSLVRYWDKATGTHSLYTDPSGLRFNYLSVVKIANP